MIAPPPTTRREWLAAERGFAPTAKPAGALAVALVYPNAYHLGMSSLGFQMTYRVINDHPRARAERFFLDSLAEGSIESGAPLAHFDLIAISACYEMDAPHLLETIEAAGLPIEARERGDGARPLVLLGGVLPEVNRLPYYPFFDLFTHGDAEVILPGLLDALADARGRSLADRLSTVEGLPGVEIADGARAAAGWPHDERLLEFGRADLLDRFASPDETPAPAPPPARATLASLDNDLAATQILTPHTEFSDMALVDLARGCPHHCTFCWIGHNTPTFRARPIERVIAAMESWRGATDRFGLVSSAVGAHPEIDDICRWAMARDLRISYSSLRVEEVTPTMLEALARGGQKTITIAPETGSERVRRLLGKRIGDEEILDVVARAMELGAENIKLYMMIGIPSETDEEALAAAAFAERVRGVMLRWARPRGRMGYVGVNLGVFTPKPNLPLNHIEPPSPAALRARLRRVVRALGRIPNMKLNVGSPELASAQSILSVGGIEAARYLLMARAERGDWRAANRRWRRQAEAHHDRRRELGRIPGERLRERARALTAP